MSGLLKRVRLRMARMPSLRRRVPDEPAVPVRDLWPGDAARGARLLKGELALAGGTRQLKPGLWSSDTAGDLALRGFAHGFTWLRDLRAIGTDAARMRARALVSDWIQSTAHDELAERPDIAASRLTAWLGHFDFFAASADDDFRTAMIWRIVSDARLLSAGMPSEDQDGRALTALKGLIAASIALPGHAPFLARALRFLPQEIGRQILPDGGHIERSPASHFAALKDLVEIRALLHAGRAVAPPALSAAIDRLALGLRTLRHPDGTLALFNGRSDDAASQIDLVLTQAGRSGRAPFALADTGFHRMQAGRSTLIIDTGTPAPRGADRTAHAGTLSFELSIGRERLIVNCGGAPSGSAAWQDAARTTAAHSTLVIADTSSSEITAHGLGRRPEKLVVERQEAGGAQWLDASHDGWRKPFGALHRRRLYIAETGDDIRGEDIIEAARPQPFTIRFHLHPSVMASVQEDGNALLRLPSGGWKLRAEGARLSVEESIFLAGAEPRRTEQVVLTGRQDGPQHVKWAITKMP